MGVLKVTFPRCSCPWSSNLFIFRPLINQPNHSQLSKSLYILNLNLSIIYIKQMIWYTKTQCFVLWEDFPSLLSLRTAQVLLLFAFVPWASSFGLFFPISWLPGFHARTIGVSWGGDGAWAAHLYSDPACASHHHHMMDCYLACPTL
jgi:hypothetical protein